MVVVVGREGRSPAAVVVGVRSRCGAMAVAAVFPSGRVRGLQGVRGCVRLFL